MDIKAIKSYLKEHELDAYIVAHGNQFIGQDILDKEHKLKHLCNFSGSAGIMAVSLNKTYLLVDGRYQLQARLEVKDDDVVIIDAFPSMSNLCKILYEKGIRKIGYDAWSHTIEEIKLVKCSYPEILLSDEGDLVGINDKTGVSVLLRDTEFSGLSRDDKIVKLSDYMAEHNADYCLITYADSVSWLLNIYSRDLPYSPVVRAYVLVGRDGCYKLIADNIKTELFEVASFAVFSDMLQEMPVANFLCDAHEMPEKIKVLMQKHTLIDTPDICKIWKSMKNETEMDGMINCHIRDGVAVSKLLFWLDKNWQNNSELDVVNQLHILRSEQKNFWSESFASIVASAEHGAIVHYQPDEKTNIALKNNSLLLIDSGGQYFDGTTDVTRTIVLGEPTQEMIQDFTYVLKAHIALDRACFPLATEGKKLDILARSEIWKHGCDYQHGTGHGVACFGNVHEGPINISPNSSECGFMPNMVVSIEPGIYRKDKYGIRIENLVYVSVNEMLSDNAFLHFKHLTKVPIDKRLIDPYLLEEGERVWLNAYHQNVYECLAPFMNENEKLWLKDACSPL